MPCRTRETLGYSGQTPEVSEVSKKCGNLYERPDWLAEDAVHREPVSPCNFGKCREILPKCREGPNAARLRTPRYHKLGWDPSDL